MNLLKQINLKKNILFKWKNENELLGEVFFDFVEEDFWYLIGFDWETDRDEDGKFIEIEFFWKDIFSSLIKIFSLRNFLIELIKSGFIKRLKLSMWPLTKRIFLFLFKNKSLKYLFELNFDN